jgi:hypothetical protein
MQFTKADLPDDITTCEQLAAWVLSILGTNLLKRKYKQVQNSNLRRVLELSPFVSDEGTARLGFEGAIPLDSDWMGKSRPLYLQVLEFSTDPIPAAFLTSGDGSTDDGGTGDGGTGDGGTGDNGDPTLQTVLVDALPWTVNNFDSPGEYIITYVLTGSEPSNYGLNNIVMRDKLKAALIAEYGGDVEYLDYSNELNSEGQYVRAYWFAIL